MKAYLKKHTSICIAVLAAILYLPFLGSVHLFDWDEINFAECAREMLVTENYLGLQMNFLPFAEKPPLFIWLSAASMKAFGVNEFAARLPNAVCGLITLVVLFKIGNQLYNRRLALLWVLCYAGSTLPMFYFRSGIIDPWFNLFIFLGIYFFVSGQTTANGNATRPMVFVISATFIGLAVLTKGPVALIVYGGSILIFAIKQGFARTLPVGRMTLILLVLTLVGGLWFLMLALQGKSGVIQHFVSYQVHLFGTEDSGHGGPIYYHVLVLLVGCFPASIFALRGFRAPENESGHQASFRSMMLIVFLLVLILFSIVRTKIIHYSSFCYFPITFFAALFINDLLEQKKQWKSWASILILVVGGLFALSLTLLPLVEVFKETILNNNWVQDEFTTENLKAEVTWSGWEWLCGLLSFLSLITCLIFLRRKEVKKAALVLFSGNILVVNLATLLLAPKIEQYSQRAAIEFYASKKNEACYVSAMGYHSYAQYFYAERKPEVDRVKNTFEWMLTGAIDKPAYFVARVDNAEDYKKTNPQLVEIGKKNGFVFFERKVAK